ncbi:hypothetical protein SAMN04488596_105122, partial [Halanaerobium congolense]
MFSRNLPNFLLKPLMNFVLLVYLFFSRLFHVDFEPKEKLDDSYTKFNSFDDPLPDIEPNYPDYKELLAEAK